MLIVFIFFYFYFALWSVAFINIKSSLDIARLYMLSDWRGLVIYELLVICVSMIWPASLVFYLYTFLRQERASISIGEYSFDLDWGTSKSKKHSMDDIAELGLPWLITAVFIVVLFLAASRLGGA